MLIISKVNINTFHSFAYQYLLESGDVSGEILGNNILRFSLLQSFLKHNIFNYGKDYLIDDIVYGLYASQNQNLMSSFNKKTDQSIKAHPLA